MTKDAIVDAFETRAAVDPHAVLVASPDRQATVGDVDGLARAIVARLGRRRLDPGDVVVLRGGNGVGFLAMLLALRRQGAVAALLDERATDHEARHVAERLGARAFLHCAATWPATADVALQVWRAPRRPAPLPAEAAVIKLTSGSCGEPKGIATSSEALRADDLALTDAMGITQADRLLATIPFSHSYGLSSLVVPALTRATPLVLPRGRGAFEPLQAAEVCGATVFPTVPAYLASLLRVAEPPPLPRSLRLVISAGAPLLPETAARFRERFGQAAHVFYGASECGGITYDREGTAAERGTVGTPVPGVELRLEPTSSRVLVRSPAVALTYLPRPDASLRDGRFVSGDVGSWNGEELALVGRVDEVINVRGHKVDPREVEAVIAELDAVEEVRVLGVTVPESGERILRAAVACPPGSLTQERVRRWCRGRLSDFKIPRSLLFLERLPRDARGKIARAELARSLPRTARSAPTED